MATVVSFIDRANMAATASGRRIDELSQPKPTPPGFVEDRRSVYWIDRCPPCPGPNGTTEFAAMTARQNNLALPKTVHSYYQGDRPTPKWTVSKGAKSASASAHIDQLADPRHVHPDYIYTRSVYTVVSPAAKNIDPSDRLVDLSKPKPYKVWAASNDTLGEGAYDVPITLVTSAAFGARCSPRVETLAEPKREHARYRGERPVQWPVSDTAKDATPTLRLSELSQPKSTQLQKDDYNPYKVSLAARLAEPTSRMVDLALPIPRKVRQKKV